MFRQATRVYPKIGQTSEVKDALVEAVKSDQERGWRVSLSQRVLSDEGPTLIVSQLFDSLVELDERRRARSGDRAFTDRLAGLGPLLDRPMLNGVYERVVEGSVPATVGIVTRAYFQPAVGRAPALRALLEEQVAGAQAAGFTTSSLWISVASGTGGGLILQSLYADMAGLERNYRDRAPARAALGERLGGLLRAPVAVRWFESVVGYRR